jgi:hypothetical protein
MVENGLFICDVFCRLHNGESVVVADDLVRRGFSVVHSSVRRAGGPLLGIEAEAKRARIGIWATTHQESEFVLGRAQPVKVTLMWDQVTFTVQFIDRMQMIERALRGPLERFEEVPEKKKLIAVRQGDRTFRAKIQEMREGMAIVKLLDYGDAVQVPLEKVFALPPEIIDIEPQAVMIGLAFVQAIPIGDRSVDEVWGMIRERCLYLFFVASGRNPQVLLTDRHELGAGSLNLALMRLGLADYVPLHAPAMFDQVIAEFEA